MGRDDRDYKFPVTKVIVKNAPTPLSDTDSQYVRFRFLEPSYRRYRRLPYFVQYFIKTAIISFTLIAVIYYPGLYIKGMESK